MSVRRRRVLQAFALVFCAIVSFACSYGWLGVRVTVTDVSVVWFSTTRTSSNADDDHQRAQNGDAVSDNINIAEDYAHELQTPVTAGGGTWPRLYLMAPNLFGPNNQYYNFLEALKLAVALNRTLVLLPFREHRAFNHKIVTADAMHFDRTFDVERLMDSGILGGSISLEAFADFLSARPEGRVIDACWFNGQPSVVFTNVACADVGGAVCAAVIKTNASRDLSPSAVIATLGAHASARVLSVDSLVFRNSRYAMNARSLKHGGLAYRDQHLAAIRALPYAPSIVHNATRIIRALFGDDPFIAVHWRRADYAPGTAPPNCTTYLYCVDSTNITELLDVVDSAVHAFASAGGIARAGSPLKVYLATTRISAEERAHFVARGYGSVVVYPTSPGEVPYYVSLVEQEICKRAAAFVGSADSSWTTWVIESRIAQGLPHTWSTSQLLWPYHVRFSRPAPPPSFVNATACGYAYMGISRERPAMTLTLVCPPGTVASSVLFASFGAPTGICSKFVLDPHCHDPESEQHVRDKCVGRSRCDIAVTNDEHEGNSPSFALSRCETGGFALAVLLACTPVAAVVNH